METWIRTAAEAWRQLFDGELDVQPSSGSGADVEAVAVRRPDFRSARGNWPTILHHRGPSEKVLVLVHGLKDSPGYLEAIAHRFADHGANVVRPLLPSHGRRNPIRAMAQADWNAWRETVDHTVKIASDLGTEISIGGLSTGGALGLDQILRRPTRITGKVFLFSAALGLRPHQRLVLSIPAVPRWIDARLAKRPNNGIGGDPCKYSRTFFVGARQVHLLIRSLRQRSRQVTPDPDQVFVAHSEADRTIRFEAVEHLIRSEDSGQHHILPAALDVGHTELVMARPMSHEARWPNEPPAPRANPEFEPMMTKALAFLDR